MRLAFEYGAFEKPQFEQGQGVQLATERCRAWGQVRKRLAAHINNARPGINTGALDGGCLLIFSVPGDELAVGAEYL